MSFKVIKVNEIKTKKILGGPIKPVVNPKTVGSKNLVFALGVFDVGDGLVPHIHPESEEVYYVIRGRGTVYIGKEKREISIEPDMALYTSWNHTCCKEYWKRRTYNSLFRCTWKGTY